MEPREVLAKLNFGRVDAESDTRFEYCFIGTDMLRHVLQPQHSLVLGSKGSGKSAVFRLLCMDKDHVKPLLPKGYDDIFPIPVYGLYYEEYIYGTELREMKSGSIDDFRYFWLLIIGLKTVTFLVQNDKIKSLVSKSKDNELRNAFKIISQVVDDLELEQEKSTIGKIKQRIGQLVKPGSREPNNITGSMPKLLEGDFRHKTGMSVTAMLDKIDIVLRGTNTLAWLMLDKLDLMFIDDFEKLKASITGLVQLLIEQSNRFKNIHFKIFLRSDIYRQLRIVNKSHLISYTTEMKWNDSLLLKLLVSRAIADSTIQKYCEELVGEEVKVADVINGDDEDVLKLFYAIFESTMAGEDDNDSDIPFLHTWMLRNLTDGMGNVYPREQIHLGNLAAEKQIEINRREGEHASKRLISSEALREAFALLSIYRCDTYLYSEFPHLSKHFDVFRGVEKINFTREELYKLFEKLTPNGDEGIRAVYDTGLLQPLGRSVDSSMEFKIPLLYRVGLGITQWAIASKSGRNSGHLSYGDSKTYDPD